MKHLRNALALSLATATLTLAGPPSAQALTCYASDQNPGAKASAKVGVTDEGEPTYFRIDQTGSGRSCTNGTDVFNSTAYPWSAPYKAVRGMWIDPWGYAGRNPGRTYVGRGVTPVTDLGGVRYGAGRGDRCGGATVTIDRVLHEDTTITIRSLCVG